MTDAVRPPAGDVATREDQEVKVPRLYRVLLHNDHYTTMEFVVEILEGVFAKPLEEAMQIMLDVHKNGVGVAGLYPAAIAETKAVKVSDLAQESGFPLKCSTEPE